jgi:DNA-binding SARP family transcriptional activator
VRDVSLALEISARFGNAGYYAHVQSELALYLLESGEYHRAEETILEARSTLERVGNDIYLSVLERIAARLYLEWAPPHGSALSLKYAQASLTRIERAGRPPIYADGALFIAAWAEATHGRAEQGLHLADELEVLAGRLGQVTLNAGIAWVRGLALERLGQMDEARRALQTALAVAIPMQLGPTLERMGLELDRFNGDLESARIRADGFRASGADGALQVAQRYFPMLQAQAATPTVSDPTAVRLEVLGPTLVTRDGVTLSYRTRKGKELLALLCEARLAGRREVPDLTLIDTLYPDLNEAQAGRALKQLVYRLRNTLGANTILRSNTGYTLGGVKTDAEAFISNNDTRLWRGPYMSDLGEDWISSARDSLHYALQKQALEISRQDPEETARLGRILLEVDPFDLTVLRWTLQALRTAGNHGEATRLRNLIGKQFQEVGEGLPAEV